MTVTIPGELQDVLRKRAAERQMAIEELVEEALSWYLQVDPELIDEMNAWQEVRDDAWEIVGRSLP